MKRRRCIPQHFRLPTQAKAFVRDLGRMAANTTPCLPCAGNYEATSGRFVDSWYQLFPGAWLTSPVPRVFPEKNWSGTGKMQSPEGLVEDNIPEDTTLVVKTRHGLVIVAGCYTGGELHSSLGT